MFAKKGAAPALMEQLGKAVKADGAKMASKVKGMIVFKIDDVQWTLDLREGAEGALYEVRQAVTARQLHARPNAARWTRPCTWHAKRTAGMPPVTPIC